MGEIVAAAIVGHVPTVMLPESVRRRLGNGQDTTLVDGFGKVRQAIEEAGADTLVIFDTHWFTTTEHVVDGREHHRGSYTSEELPNVISDYEFDYPGAPELGKAVEEMALERAVPVINATNEHLGHNYPTLNVLHYVRSDQRVLSVGICQTATPENYLDFGDVLGQAIRRTDTQAALLASGGMSHKFWELDKLREHNAYGPEHLHTPEAREIDERIIDLWADGDHAAVIDLYPEYRKFSPEGFFGHYLMLAGALGGHRWKGKGRKLSEYENAVGTGQVHVVFEVSNEAVDSQRSAPATA
jgi:3,4-dihydroxyphenylacetate 2,3-dioxygenase